MIISDHFSCCLGLRKAIYFSGNHVHEKSNEARTAVFNSPVIEQARKAAL